MIVNITIQGTTPLIVHRFTEQDQLNASKRGKITITGNQGTPREVAENKLYVSNGKSIIPTPNFLRCLIDAGAYFKFGKKQLTTAKSSLIPACVFMRQVEAEIVSKEGWCVDTRPVRIPSTGGRILQHRPIFNDWELTFQIEVDTDMLDIKLFREIVDVAGKRIGLGDFRPTCKGPYGQFVVVKWEEENK